MRYALRGLRRQPGFALLAVLTMALGTGAITVLFGLTYSVLWKPLPWAESDRLVRISESRGGREPRVRGTITNATFVAWHEQPALIESIGGWRNVSATAVIGNGDPTQLQTAAVTPSLFTVLRVSPHIGRVFVEDDGRPGASFPSANVIVLSYRLWQERFGAQASALGGTMIVGGTPHTIVGVMPEDFTFPDRATRAWTPWAVPGVLADQGGRRVAIFQAMARLRPGVSPAQASAEGTARSRSAPDPGLAAVAMFGSSDPADISAAPAIEMMTAEVRPALLIMIAAVALLLLTSTANVASLQLARATARRREIAIRAAIGADARRLARELALESVAIGVVGGLVGFAFAAALTRMLPALLPGDFPRIDDIAIDARVGLFSALISLAAGLSCSLLPVVQTRRLDVRSALADAASTTAGGFVRTPTMRARTAIMTAQIAVACVLLVGAALLTRSFVALINSDRGYDPRNLLTARLPLPADVPLAQRTQMLDNILARLRTVPGIAHAAYGNALPLLTSGGFRAFKMRPPIDPSAEVEVNVMQRVVSPDYFAALGLRLVSGRTFTAADTMTARGVIVVNRSFAAKYLGPEPLGAIVPNLGMCRGDDDQWEVVGMIDDMRQGSVTDLPQPELLMPYAQVACPAAVTQPIIVLRSTDDPAAHAAILRSIVRQEAPNVALDSMMTMDERVMTTLAKPRLYAMALAGFAAFALAIAAVGLFGVLSYSVAQRAREIGVRTALGASPRNILTLVGRQVALIAAVGIASGLSVAYAGARWLESVIYGVTPHDVASFVIVPVVLLAAIAIASSVPAWRAAHVDPLSVMRA